MDNDIIMKNDIICPVCGKHDIPNYHKQDVICPCCGSDLSIYRVVDEIPNKRNGLIWKISTMAAVCAGIVLSVCLVKNGTHNSMEQRVLTDSISVLNQQLVEFQVSTKEYTNAGFPYIVRAGDSFWKISRHLYGTGRYATQIAEMNNLTVQDVIHKGDTLFIK